MFVHKTKQTKKSIEKDAGLQTATKVK